MKTKHISNRSGDLSTILKLAAGIACLAISLPVSAATFDVTTFDDELTGNGQCSLREAIVNANNNAATYADCPAGEAGTVATDVINLPAGTYNLTIIGVDERCDGTVPCTSGGDGIWLPVITSDASKGDLDINDDVSIIGLGVDPEDTIIQWAAGTADNDPLTGDRIFHVAVPAGATANIASVEIENLAVANGEVGVIPTVAADVCIAGVYTPANLGPYDIFDHNATDADCVNHTIKIDQFRRMGGAIALGGGYSVVTYEEALHGPDAGGGGGVDMGPFPGGKPGEEEGYSIENVSLNRVGMIASWAGADGGGIYSAAPATINESVISGNTSNANGGGIYNDAVLTISNTLIGRVFDTPPARLANPNVGENGGGMFDTGSHTTTILNSAINGNEAIGGGGIAARALINVNITNSTISGNVGTDVGGGITTNGTVRLHNSTVANNDAATDAPGGGGGLNSFGSGTYILSNTLLSNNVVSGRTSPLSNCGCTGGSATCPAGRMVSLGYNLENGDSCDLGQTGDQTNTDALLVALADNGGLTETHKIPHIFLGDASDSPAVDAGDNNNCPNNDQRGSLRPVDGDGVNGKECDIGAFELVSFDTDLLISGMVAPDEVFNNDNYTVTVTILNNTVIGDTGVMFVTDALPAEVAYVSATATGGSVNTCGEATGVVSCDIGDLAGGASATVTLTLTASTVGDATVVANITSTAEPTATGNNIASVSTTIIGEADLALSVATNTGAIYLGHQVTATFTVTNLGVDDASGVRLTGTMPPEVELISATPDNGSSCTITDAEMLCELGDLAVAGPVINVAVVLRGDQLGTVADISASVDAVQRDLDESNNTATATVTIVMPSSDDGGFCSYHPNGRFDPVLPAIVLIGLAYLAWRRKASQ